MITSSSKTSNAIAVCEWFFPCTHLYGKSTTELVDSYDDDDNDNNSNGESSTKMIDEGLCSRDDFSSSCLEEEHLHHHSSREFSSSSSCLEGAHLRNRRRRLPYKKCVSFVPAIEVREYAVTLGDHPGCGGGLPLTLSWSHVDKPRYKPFEESRSRQGKYEMPPRLSYEERLERLATMTMADDSNSDDDEERLYWPKTMVADDSFSDDDGGVEEMKDYEWDSSDLI